MKSISIHLKPGFTGIYLLIFSLVLTASACAQSQVVAETSSFALVSEYENYTYKTQGAKVKATRLTGYWLVRKGVDYTAVGRKGEAHFTSFRNLDGKGYLLSVEQDKRVGFLDLRDGKMVLQATYTAINAVGDSAVVATKNKKEMVFGLDGRQLIDKQFDKVISDPARKVLVAKRGKDLDLYSMNGKLLAAFPNTSVEQFHDNEIVLVKGGKYGICDLQGKQVVPFDYADAFFGEQYLSLAKKTSAGIKYGMFTSSDLKTELFPFESDYLRHIPVSYEFNVYGSGFLVYNAQANTLLFLDEQKMGVAEFARFPDKKTGLETARSATALGIIYDYYSVVFKDGFSRVFLRDGQKVSDELFEYCTHYDNALEGYVLFQGSKTLILPWEYKSAPEYLLPVGIYDIVKINDMAYSVSTEYGENVFRPNAKEPLINMRKKEVTLDYNLYENFGIMYLLDYNGTHIAYDMYNDSLLFQHYNHEPNSQQLLFNYMASTITPLLKVEQPDHEVNGIYDAPAYESERAFSYTDETGATVLPDLPYRLVFNKSDAGEIFIAQADMEGETPWTISVALNNRLQVIKPFSTGYISNTMIFENDTVFISDFYGAQDSTQVYSSHFGKTIYYKDLLKLSGQSRFYPNVTRHGIMNYEGKNGLIGLDGKLVIPFKYDYFSNEDAEFVPRSVMGFSDGKEFLYYFTEPKLVVRGMGYAELTLFNTDAYLIKANKDQYYMYDKRTAQLVFNKAVTVANYGGGRYMVVGSGASYGIFDLQALQPATDMVYSREEADRIFAEQFSNE